MSDDTNIDIIIKGRDQASQSLGKVDDAVSSVGDSGTDAMGQLGGLASMMSGPLLAGAGALAAGILAVGAAAFSMAQDSDQAGRDLQAQLGLTKDEADALKPAIQDLFANGMVASAQEGADAIIAARQQFKGLADDDLPNVANKALMVSNTFGEDYSAVLNSAATLQNKMGISADEAFDFITKGYQNGLNSSGDFLDSLGEYTPLIAQMGMTTDQYFSILKTGIQGGVLGTDKILDLFKEFSIRIKDGSDTTSDAINDLFTAIGQGDPALAGLKAQLASLPAAIDANKVALTDAEGAYATSQDLVKDLTARLGEARRELQGLSAPKLAGMQEYDDQIFGVQQRIKSARLEMVGMEHDSPEFKASQEGMDKLNQELDRLSLERDITFDAQLRDIQKATEDATAPALTYDQVMQQIGDKKNEIAGLTTELATAEDQTAANEKQVQALKDQQGLLNTQLKDTKSALETNTGAAGTFLETLKSGGMSEAEAMEKVMTMLKDVKDPIEQNRLGVALMGTQWEDMGKDAVLAVDQQTTKVGELTGATDGLSVSTANLGSDWTSTKNDILLALGPLGDELLKIAKEYMPELKAAGQWLAEFLRDNLPGAIEAARTNFHDFQRGLDVVVGVFHDAARGAEYLSQKIQEAKNYLAGLDDDLPDWLRPGSPTPFELGLKGISQEMAGLVRSELPRFAAGLDLAAPLLPDLSAGIAGAAGGGAGVGAAGNLYVTNQIGGSVVTQDDLMRATVEALRRMSRQNGGLAAMGITL